MQAKRTNIRSLFVTGAVAGCVVVLYFFVYPLYDQYFPKCLLYNFTGLYCPGCGTQRAFSALLHGDILKALHNNLLAIVFLPFIIYAFTIYTSEAESKQMKRNNIFYSKKFVVLVLTTVIVFSVARNIHKFPFYLLAPLN